MISPLVWIACHLWRPAGTSRRSRSRVHLATWVLRPGAHRPSAPAAQAECDRCGGVRRAARRPEISPGRRPLLGAAATQATPDDAWRTAAVDPRSGGRT